MYDHSSSGIESFSSSRGHLASSLEASCSAHFWSHFWSHHLSVLTFFLSSWRIPIYPSRFFSIREWSILNFLGKDWNIWISNSASFLYYSISTRSPRSMVIYLIWSLIPMISMISDQKTSTLLGRSFTTFIEWVISASAREQIDLIMVTEFWLRPMA